MNLKLKLFVSGSVSISVMICTSLCHVYNIYVSKVECHSLLNNFRVIIIWEFCRDNVNGIQNKN